MNISYDLITSLLALGLGQFIYMVIIGDMFNDIRKNKFGSFNFIVLLIYLPFVLFCDGATTGSIIMTFLSDNGVIITDYSMQAACLICGFIHGFVVIPALSLIVIIIQTIFWRLKRKSEPVDEWEQALKEGRRIK